MPATIDNTADGSYVFTPDAGQCATGQTLNVTITVPTVPDFALISPICSGATPVPTLNLASPNGVNGTWLPATIDNENTGSYVFTPDAGQCATGQTLNVTITVPTVPDFALISPICSGATPVPTLNLASPNGVNGTWLPATIDNENTGSYVFTPDAGQCALGQTLNVTVTPPINLLIDGGCDNGNYRLTVSSDLPIPSTATYQWVDSTGATIGTSDSVVVSSPGTYTCNVTNDGCVSSTSESPISVTCTIQKGISPRGTGAGDGKNDFLKLACKKLEIFNRYGMVVYSKNNYSNDWYGQSDSGSELPDGTYFYVVEQNNAPAQTGWIYINREQ